jgi:hypothetical protein
MSNFVTFIGQSAFQGCNFTSIDIPNSVTSISVSAFAESNIASITIPNSITTIETTCFQNCHYLTTVNLPNSIIEIKNGAFDRCYNLSVLNISTVSPPTISSSIFPGDTNLIHIYVPCPSVNAYKTATNWSVYEAIISCDPYITFVDPNVEAICATNWGSGGKLTYEQAALVTTLNNVFSDNNAITSFNELQYFINLTSLSKIEFRNCISLASILIPSSVTTISEISTLAEEGTFRGCVSLTSIDIPSSVTFIGMESFIECSNLTSITIPNTVTYIGEAAFQGCGLTAISMPNLITSIEHSTFQECALNSITIPSLVTTIGTFSFRRTNLASIGIPSSVITIYEQAFALCYSLTTVTVEALTPPVISSSVFSDDNLTHIYVPSESVAIYKVTSGWIDYASIISAI